MGKPVGVRVLRTVARLVSLEAIRTADLLSALWSQSKTAMAPSAILHATIAPLHSLQPFPYWQQIGELCGPFLLLCLECFRHVLGWQQCHVPYGDVVEGVGGGV